MAARRSSVCRARSSKPAARRCCCRSTGQTDVGRTFDRFMTLTANHNSFRVLFDKIASVIILLESIYTCICINILTLEMASPPTLCQLYRHTFVPYRPAVSLGVLLSRVFVFFCFLLTLLTLLFSSFSSAVGVRGIVENVFTGSKLYSIHRFFCFSIGLHLFKCQCGVFLNRGSYIIIRFYFFCFTLFSCRLRAVD